MDVHQKLFKEAEQILLGTEIIFENHDLIKPTRVFVDGLANHYDDLSLNLKSYFEIIKRIRDDRFISLLKLFVMQDDPKQLVLSLFDLLEVASNTRFQSDPQNVVDLMAPLRSIYLEQDTLIKIKKLCKLLEKFYDDPMFDRVRKVAEHFITLKSAAEIWALLDDYQRTSLFNNMKGMKADASDFNLGDAFSKGQIRSKIWLVDELEKVLDKDPKQFVILCGWYALLAWVMEYRSISSGVGSVTSIDIDPNCEPMGSYLHIGAKRHVQFRTDDIFDLDYNEWDTQSTVLVNTSCEHIANFSAWYEKIPEGAFLVLQSNDFFEIEEHVNCVKNIEEFQRMAPMRETLFAGELPLEHYTRFMLIGRK